MPDAKAAPNLHLVPAAASGRQSVTRQPYNLDPGFEAALVAAMCYRPALYLRVGKDMDPDLLPTPQAVLALKAVSEIHRDTGIAPSHGILVVQRMRLWTEAGKVSFEKVQEAADWIGEAWDRGVPGDDEMVSGIVPILRQRMEQEAVILGTTEFAKGKGGDLGKVTDLIARSRTLGETDTMFVNPLSPASLEDIKALSLLKKYPIGIAELDTAMNGGLAHGGLAVVAGMPGLGKSMLLDQIVAHGLLQGQFVGLITLSDMSKAEHESRVIANLTGVAIDDVLSGTGPEFDRAEAALEAMLPRLGRLVVLEMEDVTASVQKIEEWVLAETERAECKMNGLCIDMLKQVRKIGLAEKIRSDDGGERTELVFRATRDLAHRKHLLDWIWTADHLRNRNAMRHKNRTSDDVSGSSEKIRACDLLLLMEPGADDTIHWKVEKNRHGPWPVDVGCVPHHKAHGRIGPVQRM